MRNVMCAVVAVLVAVPAFAENPPDVRVLTTKGVKFDFTKAPNGPKAVEIKTADELAKSALFSDDTGRDAIKKQVDFAKEKLVVFVWQGSGGDKLTGVLAKRGGTAEFTYTAGFTDDLRQHAHAFAVPKDAKVEVKK
jgi:hypothetical protein